jgi:hypothetical protein
MNRKISFSTFGLLIVVMVALALLLMGCGPKITSGEVVEKLRAASYLTTTKYTIQVVVKANNPGSWWLLGLDYKKALLVAKGRVEAGIDLNQLAASDVIVSGDGKSITVNLPPVNIHNRDNCLSNNTTDTYVYSYSSGLFADITTLQTELRGAANDALVEAACNGDIMQRATDDAKFAIEHLLKTIFPTVNVTVMSAPAPSIEECKAK